jgi:hypothetical protein
MEKSVPNCEQSKKFQRLSPKIYIGKIRKQNKLRNELFCEVVIKLFDTKVIRPQ